MKVNCLNKYAHYEGGGNEKEAAKRLCLKLSANNPDPKNCKDCECRKFFENLDSQNSELMEGEE